MLISEEADRLLSQESPELSDKIQQVKGKMEEPEKAEEVVARPASKTTAQTKAASKNVVKVNAKSSSGGMIPVFSYTFCIMKVF